MSGFEGLLAAVIILQSAVQLIVLSMLYRSVAKLADRTDGLLTKVEPQIDDLASGVRAIREAAEFTSTEIRATMASVRDTAREMDHFAHCEAAEVRRVLRKATAAAERQIEQVDGALDAARGRLVDLDERCDRTLLEPARTVLAVAAGVRRAVRVIAAPDNGTRGGFGH